MISGDDQAVKETSGGSLKERAYKIIRENIISCRLAPGSVLNEKELVRAIGASRTPIREALSRLEQEKLVIIVPQRGTFVSEITAKTINDVYQVREILEPCLVRLATPLIATAELEAMRDEFLRLTPDDYDTAIAADDAFHSRIVSLSNNTYLIQLMENMYAQNERIRSLMIRFVPQRLKETCDEHLAVVEAMLRRDAEQAAEAMRQHMISARRAAFMYGAGTGAARQ